MLFKSESEVMPYLAEIYSGLSATKSMMTPTALVEYLDDRVNAYAVRITAGVRIYAVDYRLAYLQIGAGALLLLRALGMHEFVRGTFAQMLLGKHVRYGDKGLLKWGHPGMLMRLGSKVDRASNLLKNPHLDTDQSESVFDTVHDIIGYCVLGMMILDYKSTNSKGEKP